MNQHNDYKDEDLVALLNEEESRAFEMIYRKYASELYKYARHLISTKEDCEEIIQEVFERLWIQRQTIKIKSLRAYLYKCVKNKVINYFEHKAVKKKYADHYLFFGAIYDSVEEDKRNAEIIHQLIERGIKTMPEQLQRVIQLRLVENLSNPQIAQRMNIAKKTVDNYIHLVYVHLRSFKITTDNWF